SAAGAAKPAPAQANSDPLRETSAWARNDGDTPRPHQGHLTPAKQAGDLPNFDISHLNDFRGPFRLNDYEIRERLGRGGMGVVFKAHDPKLDRFVAIKMLTPETLVSSESRRRFEREARTVAAIQHENVVSVYAIGEVHGLPYM